jgi:aryl-alcohol dehydrogenase-like predicted oxidoreductase
MTPRDDARRSRHRIPAQRQGGAELPPQDPDLDSYLAALAPDAGSGGPATARFGSAQVFPLRLPALRMEQLRRLAAERGVSPGALAVDWVLERLDQEDTETGPLPIDVAVETPVWRNALRRLGRQ